MTEDHLMRDLKYPKSKLDAHRTAHSEALNCFRDLLSDYSLNNSPPKRISEFISDWTYVHESTEDRELSMFLDNYLNSGKPH